MSKHHNHSFTQQEANEPLNEPNNEPMTEQPNPDKEAAAQSESSEEPVEALQERIQELEDKNLRMMAEFDNYRRRTNKEKLELMDTAGERIFRDMLPLIDDLERAMQAVDNATDLQALKEGMQLIYQKFLAFLEQEQVTPISTEGEAFNTDLHEAITTFAAGEDKKGMVIDCTQKGYKLGDKVIRYAKVVVGE